MNGEQSKSNNCTTPNETLLSVCWVCVCRFGISFTYVIEVIESKLISVCLINDYSLSAHIHIFVYERAKFFSISLECTKVKLLMLTIILVLGAPILFWHTLSPNILCWLHRNKSINTISSQNSFNNAI